MHLSFRQQAMRMTIWISAIIFIARALTPEPSAILPAFTLLIGAVTIEFVLLFARRQIMARA